jgi:large repetitive protein
MNLRAVCRIVSLACALLAVSVAPVVAADLTVTDGVVIKFGPDAGLTVRDRITTASGVQLTSIQNDSVAGQTGRLPGTPLIGQWRGLKFDPAVVASNVSIPGLRLSYAGGNTGAALEIPALNVGALSLQGVVVTNSVTGIRISGGSGAASANLTGFSVFSNTVGVDVLGNATATFSNSEFVGNTSFGIRNQTPSSIVQATGNWWGATSGPKDTDGTPGNPNGTGDRVSTGVNYGAALGSAPLIDCSIRSANGNYTTVTPAFSVALACRNAVEVRIAESTSALATAVYGPISNRTNVTLSAAIGDKTLYAEFRSGTGVGASSTVVSTPQLIRFTPNAPQVTFNTPVTGATITADTTLSATVVDTNPIASVQFYANGQAIGSTLTASPYSTNWVVAAVSNGSYTLEARATNSLGAVGSATVIVTLAKPQTDTTGPVISALSFANAALASGQTIASPGSLSFTVVDSSGIGSVIVKVGGIPVSGGVRSGNLFSVQLDFLTTANGSQPIEIVATDSLGNVSTTTLTVTLALPAPAAAPQITSPASNTAVTTATVSVFGTAPIGTQVQLYLNNTAQGGLISVNSAGNFFGQVTLGGEGSYSIAADARNVRGTTPRSASALVSYAPPGPQIALVSPASGIKLADPTVIEANVASLGAIAHVAFSVNGQEIGKVFAPPYRLALDVAAFNNGPITISVTATDTAGKAGSDSRSITIEKRSPEVLTPYVGEVLSVSPTESFGQTNVVISGRAKQRGSGVPVPNATLRLVLRVSGFERKLNVVTDAIGNFSFGFIPQPTDQGTYSVSVVHPEAFPLPAPTHTFSINRVATSIKQYSLNASKGFSETIRVVVSASQGSGVRGITISAPPGAQIGGTMPAGISVASSGAIDIAAGQSVPIDVTFTSTAAAVDTGILILNVFSTDSGTSVRGDIRVDYRLFPAQPALIATPSVLEMGMRQGQVSSAVVAIENKGLVAAQNVTVSLTKDDGSPAPAWMNLVSAPNLGVVAPGAKPMIQMNAAPTAVESDGIYQFKVRVTSSNAPSLDIPLSVAITQTGEGRVQFQVVDLFTGTKNADGSIVTGAAGITVTIENENVPTIRQTLESPVGGTVLFNSVPPGSYRYRLNSDNHSSVIGRIRVNPGALSAQRVFLNYNLVNFSFSVSETVIQDVYDVTINAAYRTFVPAAVVVAEPAYINIPLMQVGEETTGEMTITNYGLIRADEVTWKPPVGDAKVRIEFFGTVPKQLAAKERIVLQYKITQLAPLTGLAGVLASTRLQSTLNRSSTLDFAKDGGCSSSNYPGEVCGQSRCAEGDTQKGCSPAGAGQNVGGGCGGSGEGLGGGGTGGGLGGGTSGSSGPTKAGTPLPGKTCPASGPNNPC